MNLQEVLPGSLEPGTQQVWIHQGGFRVPDSKAPWSEETKLQKKFQQGGTDCNRVAHPPAGVAHLDACLADVDGDHLSHGGRLSLFTFYRAQKSSCLDPVEEPLTDSNESEELPRVGMCSHNVATIGLPPQSPRSQGGGRQGWKALGNPVFNKPTTTRPECPHVWCIIA